MVRSGRRKRHLAIELQHARDRYIAPPNNSTGHQRHWGSRGHCRVHYAGTEKPCGGGTECYYDRDIPTGQSGTAGCSTTARYAGRGRNQMKERYRPMTGDPA